MTLSKKSVAILIIIIIVPITIWGISENSVQTFDSDNIHNEDIQSFTHVSVDEISQTISISGYHGQLSLPRSCYAQLSFPFQVSQSGIPTIEFDFSLNCEIEAGFLSSSAVSIDVFLHDINENLLDMTSIFSISASTNYTGFNNAITGTDQLDLGYTVQGSTEYILIIRLVSELNGHSSIDGIELEDNCVLRINSVGVYFT